MRVAIDSNSLLALVRYYLPFDTNDVLYNLVKEKIQSKDIAILDAVLTECKFLSSGLILQQLNFLKDKDFKKKYKLPIRTNDLLPPAPARFIRQVENQFAIGVMKNKLGDHEFEQEKNKWLSSADAKLIIFCLNHIQANSMEEIFLVTEESKVNNDLKVFKKIPAICEILGINVLTIPELLSIYNNDELELRF